MRITFRGAEADQHILEAKTGLEAVAGLTAAAARVAHYVAEGEVRFRQPFSDKIGFYVEAIEPGSLDFVLKTVIQGGHNAAALASKTHKVLSRVLHRASGKAKQGDLQLADGVIPEGDIDVLAEAVEPSLRRAHAWTDTRGKSITLAADGARSVRFDLETREYLQDEIEDRVNDVQDVSVGALNVNRRTGRVFFHDLQRSVPFYVDRAAKARTIPTLSRFLTQYAEKTGAKVNINFKRIRTSDKRLKRIIIFDCYAIRGLA